MTLILICVSENKDANERMSHFFLFLLSWSAKQAQLSDIFNLVPDTRKSRFHGSRNPLPFCHRHPDPFCSDLMMCKIMIWFACKDAMHWYREGDRDFSTVEKKETPVTSSTTRHVIMERELVSIFAEDLLFPASRDAYEETIDRQSSCRKSCDSLCLQIVFSTKIPVVHRICLLLMMMMMSWWSNSWCRGSTCTHTLLSHILT